MSRRLLSEGVVQGEMILDERERGRRRRDELLEYTTFKSLPNRADHAAFPHATRFYVG